MLLLSTLFPLRNSWLLILAFLLWVISLFFSFKNKERWALVSLFFTAIILRLFMAHLDPFLHEWDERFHALVARNMMHDPLKPMLRIADWVPYDYKDWSGNHIWLHKQPLFLWQMALSMKIFGVSEFAIRYPGVLMGSIGVLMLYRISVLMTGNKTIAFTAASLCCFSYYPLELLSGLFGMDQNDTAFSFYVLASIWAYAEYTLKRSLKYALLIGLFSGGAILIKWLTGLLVFSAWGIMILLKMMHKNVKNEIFHFLIALLVCTIVFLPWQLYIMHTFPIEAAHEYEYNLRHLHEEVEGRGGSWLYYIQNFNLYYGNFICFLLPGGIILILACKKYYNYVSFSIVIYFILSLLFFSLASKTKILGYFMIVMPLGYIFISIALFHIISHRPVFKYLCIPAIIIVTFLMFNLPEITRQHDPVTWEDWKTRSYNDSIYKNLKNYLPPNTKLVVCAKDYIDIMFYNNDIDAYNWFPEKEFSDIRRQHLPVAAFLSPQHQLYGFMGNYDSMYIVPVTIK